MKTPVGKFKGQAVDSLPSQYLAWLVTRDHIRFKHWPLIKEALRVLRSRAKPRRLKSCEHWSRAAKKNGSDFEKSSARGFYSNAPSARR